ncbi:MULTISPECIES: heavy-metal-associated domain-containing protein [Aureimonas]|uniref:Copper chaperone n=2 Tax=Aureimonas TaxID=414371 RepID=A0A1H0HE04_9HYPH|nr:MULTISPECIES: heavy-metal-associated domain-containing protein [Aureimonas]MBB3934644.1 copper chaperone [Aureimonas phyllosphaerae]MBB3950545.1 copper chaperone [Aureimonas jatrophae]MBB3958140.1 copper chaperone [Aureimonas phyllosphaerae]SDO17378.1 copper chaperone [Aureimonas jatrophae]
MLKLKVQDMSCGHCASTVRKAVTSVDPAAEVTVDLPSGTVTVESAASEASIGEAIRAAGYRNETLTA